MTETEQIRNFSIIAHIDHGKSTLADRFLQFCHTIEDRMMKDQFLDNMDIERERGITIKSRAVTIQYKDLQGNDFKLNLIDTPGHVDFSYEVNRSLAACEGVVLLVDSTQGIQAQTLANLRLAHKRNLEVIVVINKIDLPNADVELRKEQIQELLNIPEEKIFTASAKAGIGIRDILEGIIKYISPPKDDKEDTLKALVFDSHFDKYRGVIMYARIFSGTLSVKDTIYLMHSDKNFDVLEVGIFCPDEQKTKDLKNGEVGYIIANIREPGLVKIGDTITLSNNRADNPLSGFQDSNPMVFSGVYPVDPVDYEALKAALEKLSLNDSSLRIEAESSVALGFGFRVGFLGLLHMEIIQERIDREYGVGIIMTNPSVIYKIMDNHLNIKNIDNPSHFPAVEKIAAMDEPYVKAFIMAPATSIGSVMRLCGDKRGDLISTESLMLEQVMLTFLIPLAEILTDFNDKLKSITQGYGSMEYDIIGYKPTDLVKLDILLNAEPVDAFSCLVHRSKARDVGQSLISKLKKVIPRHMFSIPIQAAIGQKIVARETIKALRKNVTAKCYGGDITRKKKLLEKQKEGKKKMKLIGKVNVPKNAFIEVLKNG